MCKIEVPAPDWYKHNKRMLNMTYNLFFTAELQIHADFPDLRRPHRA